MSNIDSIIDEILKLDTNCLACKNIKLIKTLSKKYSKKYLKSSLIDYDDLFQSAFIGALHAAKNFDPKKGKFGTILEYYIVRYLQMCYQKSAWITSIPDQSFCNYNKLLSLMIKNNTDFDIKPMEMNISEYKDAFKVVCLKALSIDYDFKEDQNYFDYNYDLLEFENINNILKKMPDKYYSVISMRYGIDGNGQRTLSEISKKIGVTTQRVEQIEKMALKKIREKINIPKLDKNLSISPIKLRIAKKKFKNKLNYN